MAALSVPALRDGRRGEGPAAGGPETSGLAGADAGAAGLAAGLAGGRVVLDEIAFTGGTDALDPRSDSALARLARAIVTTSGTFLVEAHVRPSGDALADQALTDRRADAVRARLIRAGVDPPRLFAMGFGGTRPGPAAEPGRRERIEVSRMH